MSSIMVTDNAIISKQLSYYAFCIDKMIIYENVYAFSNDPGQLDINNI